MRKSIAFLISSLTGMALATAQAEDKPATAPPEDAPATAPAGEPAPGTDAEDAPAAEDAEADAELAALQAAARKAEQEENVRLARAAAAREAAKGEKHDALTTSKGRTYKKVTIKGVDEVGVRIFHEYGTARIKFAELPTEFQKRFGYDPSRAEELLQREKDLESARERAAIAALRANAGLPPIAGTTTPQATRPQTTRPQTTRPKTTRPQTTRPKTTRPAATSDDAPSDNVEVQGLRTKIAELEAVIAKRKPEADELEDQAAKIKDSAFRGTGGTGRGDPKINQKKLAEANSLEAKADAVYEDISSARAQISALRRKIKLIERNSKRD